MAREGVHPETPPVPFTPGWDLVGVVDRLGDGISGIEPGQIVAALPIHGAYAEFVCLPQRELVPVPSGLDAAEAVGLVLNYTTADRCVSFRYGQTGPARVDSRRGRRGRHGPLAVGASRRVGDVQATCSSRSAPAVSDLGGIPIDYQHQDFVKEIHRHTGEGVDVVSDPVGRTHLWHSRKTLRPGGRVVGYGLRSSLRPEV